MNLPWIHAGLPSIMIPSEKDGNCFSRGLRIIACFRCDKLLHGHRDWKMFCMHSDRFIDQEGFSYLSLFSDSFTKSSMMITI